jgi:hypothetical protein
MNIWLLPAVMLLESLEGQAKVSRQFLHLQATLRVFSPTFRSGISMSSSETIVPFDFSRRGLI